MSSAQQIWSQYEAPFRQTIDQAQSKHQIEQYFYIFTAYLSEHNIEMDTIEAMKPMIQEEVKRVIKRKFVTPLTVLEVEPNDSTPCTAPLLTGKSEDVVLVKLDIRTYNRFAKWINRENHDLRSKLRNNDIDNCRRRYKGDLWMELAK